VPSARSRPPARRFSAPPIVEQGVSGALPDAAAVTDRRPVAKFLTDLPPELSSADLTLTWDTTSDRFAITSVTLVDGRRKLRVRRRALARALGGTAIRAGRVRIIGTRGESFLTLHISGLGAAGSTQAQAATRRHFLRWSSRRKRGHGRTTLRAAGYRRPR